MQNAATKLILNIDDAANYGAELGRKADITSATTIITLGKLKDAGIIKRIDDPGRKRFVELTDKGKKLRFHLEEILKIC